MTCRLYHYTAKSVGGDGWQCSGCRQTFGDDPVGRALAADHVIASLTELVDALPRVTITFDKKGNNIAVTTSDRIIRGGLVNCEMEAR